MLDDRLNFLQHKTFRDSEPLERVLLCVLEPVQGSDSSSTLSSKNLLTVFFSKISFPKEKRPNLGIGDQVSIIRVSVGALGPNPIGKLLESF